MLSKQDIINRLKSRMIRLYNKRITELEELKKAPGDSLIKHTIIINKKNELQGISECIDIINDWEATNNV